MQGDVTSLRSNMTSPNRNMQQEIQSIQASQTPGFSEMRAKLYRIAGGRPENGAAGHAHARVHEPSASSGEIGGLGSADFGN